MGNLFVVRHSVSYYNENEKYAGNQDIPLSKKGIEDSLLLGRKFRDKYPSANIDYVFTSTLSRSFDTAVLMLSEIQMDKYPIKVSKKKMMSIDKNTMLPIVSFSELNERNYGILQNMDKDEINKTIDGKTLFNWRRDYYDGPTKGERFQKVVSRVARFYFAVLEPLLTENNILLVAHQNTIRALYFLLYNVDKDSISSIEFSNSDIWLYNKSVDGLREKKNNIILMASGKGTRMQDLTKTTPKPLLPVCDKELIAYPVEYGLQNGFAVTITYSYLKEKWDSFKKKYPQVNYVLTQEQMNYWEDFIYAYKSLYCKSNYFFMLSGDMVFDYSIITDALKNHIINGNLVTVILNKKYGKWKNWSYVFGKGKTIKDIIINPTPQVYERFFVILNKEIIDRFLYHAENNLSKRESEYGNGACFFIKTLLDMNVKINYAIYDDFLVNINTVQDLKKAEDFIRGIE